MAPCEPFCPGVWRIAGPGITEDRDCCVYLIEKTPAFADASDDFPSEGETDMAKNTAPPIQFDHSWELLASYGPRPEVWRASGYGTVLVARRAPNGKEVVLLALLSLSENGISFLAGDTAAAPGSWRKTLARLARRPDHLPAPAPMPPERVAEYLYGAYAWGIMTRRATLQPYFAGLNILRPPPGGMQRWQARLAGPGGLTPDGLVRVLKENPRPPGLPEGQELVIVTRVRLSLGAGDGTKVMERLLGRRTPPRFEKTGEREGAVVLTWLRPKPPGLPRLPAAAPGYKLAALFADRSGSNEYGVFRTFLGNRQCMGDILFWEDQAEIEALTLSRAGVLLGAFLEAAGDLEVAVTSQSWEPLRGRPGQI